MSNAITVILPQIPQKLGINAEWLQLRDTLLSEAKGLVVADETGFRAGSEILQRITKLSNQLENFRKEYTEPFLTAQRSIKTMADKAREPLETVKATLKLQLGTYAEEQRKIEAEERRKAEQAAMEAAAAAAQENQEAADLLGEAAPQEEIIVQAAPVARRAVSDSARVTTRVVWELVDLDKIPRAFLMLDERKVNEFKRLHEELVRKAVEDGNPDAPIPGIVFAVKTDVAAM
jgi:hypothetical protein